MKFVMENKSFIFRFADVEVREREFSLLKAGKVLAVEPKAFRVLLHLLSNPQELISKEELLNSVWGDTYATGAEAQFSPDGKWIAFSGLGSSGSGDPEVYVGVSPAPADESRYPTSRRTSALACGWKRTLLYHHGQKAYGGSNRHLA